MVMVNGCYNKLSLSKVYHYDCGNIILSITNIIHLVNDNYFTNWNVSGIIRLMLTN